MDEHDDDNTTSSPVVAITLPLKRVVLVGMAAHSSSSVAPGFGEPVNSFPIPVAIPSQTSLVHLHLLTVSHWMMQVAHSATTTTTSYWRGMMPGVNRTIDSREWHSITGDWLSEPCHRTTKPDDPSAVDRSTDRRN